MLYRLNSIDVRYEGRFKAPFFPIAEARAELLRQLYRSLGERYGARAADLSLTSTGAALSDLHARLTLFRGNGGIEVSAEKLTAKFNNATQPDLEIVSDCVTRALTAVESFAEHGDLISDEFISAHGVLIFDDKTQRDGFLSGFKQPSLRISTDLAPEVTTGFKVELRDPSEGWLVVVDLSTAWANENGVFLNITANFFSGGGSAHVESRVKLIDRLSTGVLRSLGLDLQTSK